MSEWRAEINRKALARLTKALPVRFPQPVLTHALQRRFTPPTPRLAIDSYWRAHPVRADRLARALASRSGAPAGWRWRLGDDAPRHRMRVPEAPGEPAVQARRQAGLMVGIAGFRIPPAPYREPRHALGPGFCCVCGQPVYRFGWHSNLWGGGPNRNAAWHAACVIAWDLWTSPSDHAALLKRLQHRRCAATGGRLWRTAEVDHRVPLFQVWGAHRDLPWPLLLRYWGVPNLQVINRSVHVDKCAQEARQRRASRSDRKGAAPSPREP